MFEANRDQELISSDRLNSPGSTQVNWVVNAWNSAALDVLDYQWSVAVPFWQDIDKLAADHDVTVALELHPQNLVFNTADVFKLIELTGVTHIGVELDASHLFWQQMDPVGSSAPWARWSSRPPPKTSASTPNGRSCTGCWTTGSGG